MHASMQQLQLPRNWSDRRANHSRAIYRENRLTTLGNTMHSEAGHFTAPFFVALICLTAWTALTSGQGDYNEGNLRFVNYTHFFSTAGRLEIYLKGRWGTICSTGFGPEDATLACNQLGYRTYQGYGTVGQLGYPRASSATPIHVSNLACDTSNTSQLTVYYCPRKSGSLCRHSQDVALRCSSPYSTAWSTVRFVTKNEKTSRYLTAGRVEIFFAGRWGTICGNGRFQASDAVGLCHILTGSTSVLAHGVVGSAHLEFDQGLKSSPVWLQNIQCTYHSNDRRYYCNWDPIPLGSTSCNHSRDLALSCLADGAVRLISGSLASTTDPGGSTGRLEIYNRGSWGTVCRSGFDQTDADVVCRQLGYRRADRYGDVESLGYSQGTGSVWLTNVRCTPGDVFLANCSHSGFVYVTSCLHSSDVALSCTQQSDTSLSTAAIAGITVGAGTGLIICCMVLLLSVVVIFIRRTKSNRLHSNNNNNVEMSPIPSAPIRTPGTQCMQHNETCISTTTDVSSMPPPSYTAVTQPQYSYQYPVDPPRYEMHAQYYPPENPPPGYPVDATAPTALDELPPYPTQDNQSFDRDERPVVGDPSVSYQPQTSY